VGEISIAPVSLSERYSVSVAAARNADIEHGAEVARALGWPADRVGFVGALGGLLEIGLPMRRPTPLAALLVRRRAEQALALEARMREQRELALRR
jgi:hypothetical protein